MTEGDIVFWTVLFILLTPVAVILWVGAYEAIREAFFKK